MTSPVAGAPVPQRGSYVLATLLLVAGLSCHLFAAAAIAGRFTTAFIAYRDHVAGFVLLTVVTLAIIAPLGRRFWRGRPDLTLVIVGVLQVLIGIVVYVNRFAVVRH